LFWLDGTAPGQVELRYFGGLQISPATVKRDLTLREAWLRRALAG